MDNIKEEVYKCSKCGLCKSVCPVFLATKNEMYSPRGRYIVLNNFFNEKTKLSDKFIDNLDICLNCSLCKEFCPSNIDSANIYSKLKKYYSKSFLKFSTKFFAFLSLYKLFNLNFVKSKRIKQNNKVFKGKVIYFEGCYNKYIDSSDKNAVLSILNLLGYKVKIIRSCCGYPYLNEGNYSKYKKNIKRIISSCSDDYSYVICSCDSCFQTLSKIENNPNFSSKLITFDKFLQLNGIKRELNSGYLYHKPLTRVGDFHLPFINKKASCSLMENFFILKHRKLVKFLINDVVYNKDQINDSVVITTCNLSKWGLKLSFKKKKYTNKVINYSEYVYLSDEIQNGIDKG